MKKKKKKKKNEKKEKKDYYRNSVFQTHMCVEVFVGHGVGAVLVAAAALRVLEAGVGSAPGGALPVSVVMGAAALQLKHEHGDTVTRWSYQALSFPPSTRGQASGNNTRKFSEKNPVLMQEQKYPPK